MTVASPGADQKEEYMQLTFILNVISHVNTDIHCNQPPGLSCRPSVCSNMAMGMPTFLERPATSTFFPKVGIPEKYKHRLIKQHF